VLPIEPEARRAVTGRRPERIAVRAARGAEQALGIVAQLGSEALRPECTELGMAGCRWV
jgi:hypothetical protein